MFPTSANDLAVWLGSGVAGGIIASILLERWGWFKDWDSKWKGKLVFGLFVALPFAAFALQAFLGLAPLPAPEPKAVVAWALGLALQGLAAFSSSQFAHAQDPATLKI